MNSVQNMNNKSLIKKSNIIQLIVLTPRIIIILNHITLKLPRPILLHPRRVSLHHLVPIIMTDLLMPVLVPLAPVRQSPLIYPGALWVPSLTVNRVFNQRRARNTVFRFVGWEEAFALCLSDTADHFLVGSVAQVGVF